MSRFLIRAGCVLMLKTAFLIFLLRRLVYRKYLRNKKEMSRTVYCIKLKKEAPGLIRSPYPGERGLWIYNNVSQEAWDLWQQHQTRLINEKHLNLMLPETRQYLTEQMEKFMQGENYDQAAGYVEETPGEH